MFEYKMCLNPYLSGDLAIVVKIIQRERPLLSVVFLYRDGTLKLLKRIALQYKYQYVHDCVQVCLLPSLKEYYIVALVFPRSTNKWSTLVVHRSTSHSLQTGAVSVSLWAPGSLSPASSPPHSNCPPSSPGAAPL